MEFESEKDVARHLPRFIDSYNERRLHSATPLRHAGAVSHGGVTQTKWPPPNPVRFSCYRLSISMPRRLPRRRDRSRYPQGFRGHSRPRATSGGVAPSGMILGAEPIGLAL